MNRSLLLVICDFLLLSLLALARFDGNAAQKKEESREEMADAVADADAADDLVAILELALDDERSSRQLIESRLEEAEQRLDNIAANASDAEGKLARARAELDSERERRQQLEARTQALEAQRNENISRLASREAELEKTRAEWLAAEQDRARIATELVTARETGSASREKLRHLQQQLSARESELEAVLKAKTIASEQLEEEKKVRNRLSAQLQIAESEAEAFRKSFELTRADLELTRAESQALRQTADRLAEGVGILAEGQDRMADAMDENRERSPNEIASVFRRAQITLQFNITESRLFGSSQRTTEALGLAVDLDGRTVALIDRQQTPFGLPSVSEVNTSLIVNGRPVPIKRPGQLADFRQCLAFDVPESALDSAAIVPVTLSSQPERFAEFVIFEADSDAYGLVPFAIDRTDSALARLQLDAVERILGDLAPTEGDFAFDRVGNLAGIATGPNQVQLFKD